MADRMNRTNLHYAAVDNDTHVTASLLAAGADPTASDTAGWTPLHFAAANGARDVAQLLIAAGADVNARDRHGNTPLARAVLSYPKSADLIALLLREGADTVAPNNHGNSVTDTVNLIAHANPGLQELIRATARST